MRRKMTVSNLMRLLLFLIIWLTPAVTHRDIKADTIQPQGPVKEPQKVTAPQMTDQSPLAFFQAILKNDVKRVEELLSQGADCNVNFRGIIPLHLAIQRGHKDIAIFLIKHGALVNLKDNKGRTPLSCIIEVKPDEGSEYSDIIQLLIEQGAKINTADTQGIIPLHQATAAGNKDIVLSLLKHGASVDAKDNAGRTPLHYAAGADYGTADIVGLLLDRGADIDAQDKAGRAPLHYAISNYHKTIVKFLIDRGANLNIVNNRGHTLHSLAQSEKYWHVLIKTPQSPREAQIDTLHNILGLLHGGSVKYYVSPDGKDDNSGILERSLKTIAAALDIVGPGDIILIRGGTYRYSNALYLDKSGEQHKPIHLWAYPGETVTIDFSDAKKDAVFVTGAYWHLSDLIIVGGEYCGICVHGSGAHHNILEKITTRANGNLGIAIRKGAAHNLVINCDSCLNFDALGNGENADGFGVKFNAGKNNVFIGTRAWSNSDDGYDLWDASNSVRLERCYAWRNGVNIWNHPFFAGNGNGFKLGRGIAGRHRLVNCLAWHNPNKGFDLNEHRGGVTLFGCTAMGNNRNYRFVRYGEHTVIRNSVSLKGNQRVGFNRNADSQHNSWDPAVDIILADEDFVSLDDSMMTKSRNPDGSIPQNDFLKLAPTSAAIDKGADIGMPFVGKRPDLGAFEYDPNEPSQRYVKMLHQYVRDRDIKKIKELLTQGEGINDKDWLGYTPLQWAVYFGYSDVVELLLSQGADPDIQSDTGRFALEIAKAMVYDDIEELLHKHGEK